MKELKKEFMGRGQVKGFKFTQIKKNKYAFLYKVEDDFNTHYEVFERRINKRHNCESYPSNKSFGIWASTNRDIAKCLDTFDELSAWGEFKESQKEVDNEIN